MLQPNRSRQRPDFPKNAFYGGLALFAALTALFCLSNLDRDIAYAFYRGCALPWPGRSWLWSEALYRWGPYPADLCGALGLAAFALSFTTPKRRAWRGPGLYLSLLLLAGPGLLSNVLAKGLAGRPRPVETLGFGGVWEFHRPFSLGLPGRGASFLSGHASNAWYFLGLVFLAPMGRRRAVLACCLAFGLAMGLARVSQGAHWTSDVLLPGAALWALAAGLSPLIHWQPDARFFRRPGLRLALAGVLLGYLSVSRVVYEERHFSGPLLIPEEGATGRLLPGNAPLKPPEVDVDLDVRSGSLSVAFDQPIGTAADIWPLSLDERFQGQGLPGAREGLDASVLSPGGQFRPGPGALALRFTQSLTGLWLARSEALSLGLPRDAEVDARLRCADGAINIETFPPGRRVLLSGLPVGMAPPVGFHAFGGSDWLRDGRGPLIALDLDAPVLRFNTTPAP